MKKLISVGLGLLLFFVSMSPVFIRPPMSMAAGSGQASVVETVGDGLRYYVVFEYNGARFRSDNVGPAFNMKMWERLTESDRRKICRNYAFAPDYRKEQFGADGSSAIVDWKNEISGWKAAGEAWANGIGAREYPDLAAFFTGDSYNNLRVDGKSLNDVKAELHVLLPEVKDAEQYQSALQLIQEIDQEYAAGQAIYEKLIEVKAKQVGNAFKAGSEVLLRDVILDNLMIPSVSFSAQKVEVVLECIGFLKDRALDLYDDLKGERDIGEILQAMQEMLDILERTDEAIISDINGKLGQLSSQLETLQSLQQQKMEARQQQMEQNETTLLQNADRTFSWSEGTVDYGIPAPAPEITDEEREARRAEVQVEADTIKSEFEGLLNEIIQRKAQAYAMIGYDDGQVLTNHPSLYDKYYNDNNRLWIFAEVDGPTGLIDLSNYVDPAAYFNYYHPYSETKAAIALGGAEIVNQWDQSIGDLEEYIEAVESLISDQTLSDGLDSVAEKANGLEGLYSSYIGGSLENHVFGGITYETIQNSLEIMLTNENQDGFGPFETDYQILAMFNDEKATVQKNMDDFADESAMFESEIASGAAEYDSLYTNLQNSATFMYGAYTSRKNLYRDSLYFAFSGDNVPIVDEAYVYGLIDEASEEQKDAVVDQIIGDLRDLRVQELEYLHKTNTGKNNVDYDANQLDQLLSELGIHNAGYDNLGSLIGMEITNSSRYLQENDDLYRLYTGIHILNLSNITQFIEILEGTSDAYYSAMIVSDEIVRNASSLRSLSNEDFEIAFNEYKNELDGCMSSSYGLSQKQIENAWEEYHRGYNKLLELREERYPNSTEVLVESIDLISSGTQTPATSIELNVGEIWQLETVIYPSDASNRLILWSSDNQAVATVNNQGSVNAVAEGTACITAASADGNAEADCYVVVGDGGGGPLPNIITVNCETPEEGTRVPVSDPILQVSGSIDAESALTEFKVVITSHADMEAGDYEGVLVQGIGPQVVGNDNRFAFTVDLRTLGEEYLVTGTEFLDGYQLYIWVVSEDGSYGHYLANYLVVEEGSNALEAAKAAAATKVQADYTAASWAGLSNALAMPETTEDEIVAKTAAINDAIAGLVRTSSSGGSSRSGSSSDENSSTTPPTTIGGTTTASTSTTANLNTATGTAAATVSTAAMATVINQAKAAEDAGQKAVVAIKAETPSETKAVQLEIPKNSFAAVANDTQADVEVHTTLATITFDNKAVETINNASGTGDVSISVATVNTASLSPQAQAIVGDRPVYNFSVRAGDTEVSSFEGGKARISIPYTPQPGEKQESIVVYYIDNNQNLVPVRGAFNPATNTVDFEAAHFSRYAVGYNEVKFKDVKAGDWYANAVGFLAARGIVSGIGDGNFGPRHKLTRGQYVVMVMKAYGIDPEGNSTGNFADAGNTYYTNYLAAAKKLNLVSGIGNNSFAPERLITRQEMFTMLYNTLQAIGELPVGTSGRNLDSFSDAGQIASWAKPAIKLLVETGTVSGSEGLIKPVAGSSRAEMAQVLYNLLNG